MINKQKLSKKYVGKRVRFTSIVDRFNLGEFATIVDIVVSGGPDAGPYFTDDRIYRFTLQLKNGQKVAGYGEEHFEVVDD